MANEIPLSEEWIEIYENLSPSNYRMIMDKRIELQRKDEKSRCQFLSVIKIKENIDNWEEHMLKSDNKKEFSGNIGEPETPEQYKEKYGDYPPGYDENGVKIK